MSDQEHHLRTLIEGLERENAELRDEVSELKKDAICRRRGIPDREESARIKNLTEAGNRLYKENAELRSTAVEVCALARVWVTVWGDRLSDESLLRFEELELQVLRKAKP